jgi:small nuclear ribonucleoprotein (snRNP)-like protein
MQMVNSIVLPIKKVHALVDSKITVEIKDEGRTLSGRLVAVDEHLNVQMDQTTEFLNGERGRNLGVVVIRGSNILTIAPTL